MLSEIRASSLKAIQLQNNFAMAEKALATAKFLRDEAIGPSYTLSHFECSSSAVVDCLFDRLVAQTNMYNHNLAQSHLVAATKSYAENCLSTGSSCTSFLLTFRSEFLDSFNLLASQLDTFREQHYRNVEMLTPPEPILGNPVAMASTGTLDEKLSSVNKVDYFIAS